MVDENESLEASNKAFEEANLQLADACTENQGLIVRQAAKITELQETNKEQAVSQRSLTDAAAKVKCVQEEVTGLLSRNSELERHTCELEEDNAELRALLEDEDTVYKSRIVELAQQVGRYRDERNQAEETIKKFEKWITEVVNPDDGIFPWERV